MAYNRKAFLNLDIAEIDNEQILQNEISLGRWIVDAILLLFSKGESYDLEKRIEIEQLGFSYIPDIYLESGCKALQLSGKTIIEIKSNLLFDTEIRRSEVYRCLIDDGLVDNLIIVYINADDVHFAYPNLYEKIVLKKADELVNQIKQAIEEGKGEVNGILRTTDRVRNDWHALREKRMVSAINDYNRYNSVLFLGAGVSVSAKVPNWNDLLMRVFLENDIYCKNDYYDVFKEMDYSNLMTARYIRKAANLDKKAVVESVRRLLYSSSLKDSELISSICAMVKGQGKVRSIITYNYDTLVEDKLNDINNRCFSVYKNNRSDGNAFPVYHVHGIVFRDCSNDVLEDIVLSEEDYHEVYSQVFDWSNVEQLHALTRNTCFFIGLSMKDPNLRRLLEIAKKGSGKAVRHYVFLERNSFSEDIEKSEMDFLIREDMLADLGLNVIWYEGGNNHQELPILLKRFSEFKSTIK